ncbi:phosphoglycerate mutase-like protein [Daldinia caldariorum]|uniref:phosphoglycerate mutase-like protein n=1 Tax=Daldinia caldariorum TaxID=326644 RepID=UPI0020076D82|nr:phosphoglycerate mutase-like protein [Daldinia caldariorum]KAI1463672.1 phosphoglycerate mutase-like protein [Daldinia caldariorum]
MQISRSVIAALTFRLSDAAGQHLAPAQDINFPRSESATNPLEWLGANGPWYAGPNVFGISPEPPRGCHVDRAAYISRHGSRYPDQGAYDGWVSMYERFQASNFTATESLAFLQNWRPVLEDPASQIAMENPTGVKEALDLGYTLRTRYPGLYREGDDFVVWANNYTRVLQTASMFVRGYLGVAAPQKGSVISVTSRGFPAGVGDSLAPSDMCPNFKDLEGGEYKSTWDDIWIPPVQNRLQKLIKGNLSLTAGDIAQIPYLCGFESHITGRLSPWCDIFTDEELKQYEYSNDLRYYYGIGPGTDLPKKMMTPFLNTLVGILQNETSTGVGINGSTFNIPKLLVSFLNDGQLTELVTASGVFDEQPALSATEKDDSRLWVGSRYVTMRGTIAFERLNCVKRSCRKPRDCPSSGLSETYVRIRLNDAVYPIPSCRNGPGSSCQLSDYARYVAEKYAAEGDWITNCNVTVTKDTPTTVKGASFFTDLSNPWVQRLAV